MLWDSLYVPALTEAGYQVITYSNRGVQPSDGPRGPYAVEEMAADAVALLDHLELKNVVMLGVSLGGFIVEELCRARPELVKCAILISCAGPTTAFVKAKLNAERQMQEMGGIPTPYDLIDALSVTLPERTLRDDDATVEMWSSAIIQVTAWAGDGRYGQFAASWSWLLDQDRMPIYENMKPVCLVMAFENDLMFPPRCGRKAAEAMSNGRFVEIPDATHGGFAAKASECVQAIKQFLAENT